MKNIVESPEIFAAYAEIDLNYYLLKDIYNKITQAANRPAIVKMVDDATGYTKEQNKENIENAIGCLENIITNKKIIEADYSTDEKMLFQIKKLQQIES